MGMILGGYAEEEEYEKRQKNNQCRKQWVNQCNCEKCRKERYYDSSMTMREED